MEANEINLPPGFVLDNGTNLPPGFVLDQPGTVQELAQQRRDTIQEPAEMPNLQPPAPGQSFATTIGQRMMGRIPVGQMVGGTVGGLAIPTALSRLTPTPLDDLALFGLGTLGAGIGGGIGEAAQQAISPYENVNFRKMGEAAIAEGLSEGIGRTGGAAAGYIGRKLVSRKALQTFAKGVLGTAIDPTEAGDRLYSMVGRRVRDDAGQLSQGTVHKELSAFFGPWKARINAKTAQGAGADITSLKRVAQEALTAHERGARILHSADVQELRKLVAVDKDGNPLVPDIVPFDWLEGHKTWWQSRNAKLTKDAKVSDTGVIRIADEAKRIQTDPKSWIGIPPEVAPDIMAFNRAYSESKELMDMVFPRRWTEALKAKPEKTVDLIGNPPEQSARGPWLRQIQNTKQALMTRPDGSAIPGGQEAWDNLRTAWWTGQINKYASSGDFDTMGFNKMLNLMGDKATGDIFTSKELLRLKELGGLLQSKNARILNHGAAVMGTIGVAGGYGAGLGWDIYHDIQNGDYLGVGKDGAVVMTAGLLATAARSPLVAKLTSSVLRAQPRSQTSMSAVIRLARYLESERKSKQGRLQRDVERMEFGRNQPSVTDLGGYRGRMMGR